MTTTELASSTSRIHDSLRLRLRHKPDWETSPILSTDLADTVSPPVGFQSVRTTDIVDDVDLVESFLVEEIPQRDQAPLL